MEQNNESKYLPELMAEKDSIDPSFEHAVRLITQEIDRIKNPKKDEEMKKKEFYDCSGKTQKLECDILVPADKYPSVNFVGRLIGPGGATMKGIQELTNTKMAVLGKGSVREKDRKKAEELKDTDEKYYHMNFPLHVHICSYGPLAQAFVNLGRAAAEIQKLLVVDEATEAQYGVQAAMQVMRGRGRGGRGGRGGMGQNQRGGGFQRGGRGGSQRGGGRGQGGGGRGRGNQFNQMQQSTGTESYTEDYNYDSYGGTSFEENYEGYGGAFESTYDGTFGAEGGYGDDFSYGQDYEGFGNGASGNTGMTFGGPQASFRGKMGRGGGGRGRQKPY